MFHEGPTDNVNGWIDAADKSFSFNFGKAKTKFDNTQQ